MKRIIFLSLGMLTALLFIQIDAVACGCPARSKDITKEVAEEFNKSSLVFSGKVVEAKWIPITEENASGSRIKAEVLTLKFAVDNWWKGKNKKEVIWQTSSIRYPDLNSGETGSNCEFSFDLGRKYLVYASSIKGRLVASVCGGTTQIENAENDIKELQKLKEVKKKNLPKRLLNSLKNAGY
jgi:viroplasmin and RNaseH domain-containing protein